MKNSPDPMQKDYVSFTNGSLLFTGNNQTVFYIGGKPSDIEVGCLCVYVYILVKVARRVQYGKYSTREWSRG